MSWWDLGMTRYYQERAARAWRAMGRNTRGDRRWNAFAHSYTAAMVQFGWGSRISRSAGSMRERGTWLQYMGDIGDRRDTYKDLYNNAIGIRLMEWMRANNKDINALGPAIANLIDRGIIIPTGAELPAHMRTITDRRFDPARVEEDYVAIERDAWSRAAAANIVPTIDVPNAPPAEPGHDYWLLPISYDPSEGAGFTGDSDAASPAADQHLRAASGDDGAAQRQAFLNAVSQLFTRSERAHEYGNLANMVGSSLGKLVGGGTIVNTAASATLGTIMQNVAQGIAAGGFNKPVINEMGDYVESTLDDFGQEFVNNLASAAIGTVSSLISLEIGNALGVKGFGAELLGTVNSSLISHAASNVLAGRQLFAGFNSTGLFKGIDGVTPAGGILPGAIGSFLGSKLGEVILAPINTEGAILSSIGATAGVWALTSGAAALGIGSISTALGQIFGAVANIGVPFVGSLVGYLLGSLIGRLFGRKKPRIPTASAETVLNLDTASWYLGSVVSANGGNRALVTDMAKASSGAINELIQTLAGGPDKARVANLTSAKQKYGHSGSTIYFDELVGSSWVRQYSGSQPDRAVERGILSGIQKSLVIGGDLIVKRAVYGGQAQDTTTLLGNITVANDVKEYLLNTQAINSLISLKPTSDFSLAWMSTLLRADELNLFRFQHSDFFGGLGGFADSFGFGAVNGPGAKAYETLSLSFEGANLRISTTDGSGPFGLLAGGNNIADPTQAARSVLIPNFGANVGYTVWAGQATSGNDIWVANGYGYGVTMDDMGYEEHWYWNPYDYTYEPYYTQVSGGDDIFVGSSYNDYLYGRTGYDWLDGGAGHDRIEGGEQDDVLIGAGDVDLLLGGTGNDYLAGGEGSDYEASWNGGPAPGGLYGEAGNDVLVGGGGNDTLFGGDGDDVVMIDQDGGGVFDYIDAGTGSDTASFERFNSGIYVNLATGRDGFYSTVTYADGWRSIENITGSVHSDVIYGDEIGNRLQGLAGDDQLFGQDGDDILDGGAGVDTLYGGNGYDTVSFASSTVGVMVDLAAGKSLAEDLDEDTLVSIENIAGSKYGDMMTGSSLDNVITGGGGDDYVGLTLGYDTIDGGDGMDVFDASGATSAVYLYYDYGYSDPDYGYYQQGLGMVATAGSATSILTNVEGFIGSDYADSLYGDYADELFDGGLGNDYLGGGSGSDTYAFGLGDGYDTVSEYNDGANGIVLKERLNWRDVSVWGVGGTGSLTVSLRPTGEYITVGTAFYYVNSGTTAGQHNHKIKTLDVGGSSVVDIDMVDWTPAGADSEAATSIYGAQNKADLIFAYGGDDYIVTAGYAGGYESRGNVIYAGDGADYISSSAGDDQFIFEYGNGADYLTDTGGTDMIIMGPSVAAEDVIYQVVVTGSDSYGGQRADLYIGLRDPNNPTLTASQVADRIRVADGATIYYDVNYGTTKLSTVEHIRVGGQEIDISKAGINFVTSYYSSYSGYDDGGGGGGYGGGGHIPPIAIDLDGDGIELRSVDGSRIVTVDSQGTLWRMGWLSGDDGFLALDRNGDGTIDRLNEITFAQDLKGAKSDLEGLAAYDSNGDGKFDVTDARWGEFKIWQDKNQDGIGTKKELMTLAEAGIVSISLTGVATGFTTADGFDNSVLATTEIGWADPTRTGVGYDVALAVHRVRSDGGGKDKADRAAGKAGGNGADEIEASLYGIQTMTEAEVEAFKAKPKATAGDGIFGRVETYLPAAKKGDDGRLTVADAKAIHEMNRSDSAAGNGRFADDEWTRRSDVAAPERDSTGDGIVAAERGKPGERGPDLTKARERDQARRKHLDEVAKGMAARDAANEADKRPVAIPDAAVMEERRKSDSFRLLPAETDGGPRADKRTGAATPDGRPDPGGTNRAPQAAAAHSSEAPADGLGNSASSPEVESPRSAAAGRSASPIAAAAAQAFPVGEDFAEAGDYGVTIDMANARLIQALAGFGGKAPMMSLGSQLPNGLLPDAGDRWLTVGKQVSVQNLASVA